MTINVTPSLPFTGGAAQTPNPWFTIANQFVPRNLHDVIKWARYITIQSPTTSEVIRKLATYPITDFNIDTTRESVKDKYKDIFKNIRFKEVLQNVGFEYFTLGNSLISIYFPIVRNLVCPTCGISHNAKNAPHIKFKQYEFQGTCNKCGYTGIWKRVDSKSTNYEDINIIRWNPEHIQVNHNPITGEYEYYYNIPNIIKQKIQKGDSLFINSIPWGFIDAVRHNQSFKFDRGNLFHLMNVTTGGTVDGVAVPPLLSLFSLVFYQATLRKANEAIAQDYLNPLRVVFPQAQSANTDPVLNMSLRYFVSNMEDAFRKHKLDKNHVVIAPTPVGYSPIGGEGKNLLVSQEIQQAEDSILLALGVSRELLSGTTNWTSSSVGLRMMENLLLSYIGRLQELIDWIIKKITSYLSLDTVQVTLEPFKLIDDDLLKQLLLQINQAGKISDSTFLEKLGLDFTDEREKMKEEAASLSKYEVETQFEVEQARVIAAKGAGKDMKDDTDMQNILSKAQSLAEQLYQADDGTRRSFLNQLKIEDYTQYLLVSKILDETHQSEEHKAMLANEVNKQKAIANNSGVGPSNSPTPNDSAPPTGPSGPTSI